MMSVKTMFTVAEVAKVIRALEGGYALSARGIRYYARTGMVVPSGGRLRPSQRARAVKFYTLVDVALLRLVCRLKRQHVHERAIWGLLVYRGEELRARVATNRGDIAVTDRAALGIGSEDAQGPKPINVSVASLMNGLSERLAAYRQRKPTIWTGLAWMPASDAMEQLSA